MNDTDPNGQKRQDDTRKHTSDNETETGSRRTGTAAERARGESTASDAYKNETGDPGRTPGKAEGVENPEKTGNE